MRDDRRSQPRKYLAARDMIIADIADRLGTVANQNGLDVGSLLQSRNSYGEIDRTALRAEDRQLPGAQWREAAVEVIDTRPDTDRDQ